jgi:hypothetical protein
MIIAFVCFPLNIFLLVATGYGPCPCYPFPSQSSIFVNIIRIVILTVLSTHVTTFACSLIISHDLICIHTYAATCSANRFGCRSPAPQTQRYQLGDIHQAHQEGDEAHLLMGLL